MEDYYEYLDSNGVTTLYKLIKDDTVALIDSYSVTINGITTNLDNHVNNADIHTPIATIEGMIDTAVGSLNYATPDYVDTKVADLVNSSPETLDTLKELSDALGNDSNFATTVANQIGSKANKDDVYTKLETDTLLEGKANSVHSHVVSDITDMPTIPTRTSQLINDSGFLTSSNGLITSVSWSDITNKPNFSTVATSGSYTDLSNTPTIPTKVSQLENDMGFGTGGDTSDCVHKTGDETIAGTKTFSNTTISNKELHYKDTKYDWTDTSLNVWCDAGNVAWFDKTGNRRMHELVGAKGGVWGKACYINENQYFSVDSNKNISYAGVSFKFNGKDVALDENLVHRSGDEYIHGTKMFSNTIHRYADITTSGAEQVYNFYDINANSCGHIYNNVYCGGDCIYNIHGAYNNKSGKTMEFNIASNDVGFGMASVEGSATKGNLETVTSATDHTAIATMGWVNNPATSTNVVHRSGDETISGNKVFRDPIFRKSDVTTSTADLVYRFEDSNNSPCGYIQNNVHYWQNNLHNRHIAHNNISGKEIYLEVVSSNDGTGFVNIGGNVTSIYNVTPPFTPSTSSTFVATMGWVVTYVNSRAGFRAVSPSAVSSSISAYYSNANTLTAEGSSSSSHDSYPSDYSDYIDISPTVGTIYTGSQLFGTLNASASGSKDSYTESGSTVYQTTAKATANFSGAFSSSAKYLCTTANAVKFRAFVSEGTTSDMGTATVVDNSSTKSIFTRIE